MEDVKMLSLILIILIFVLMILVACYVIVWFKNRKNSKKNKNSSDGDNLEGNNGQTLNNSSSSSYTNKDSIYNFMEFDDIKDNMIIRKNRLQYVMVIRCRGINYDLMSEEEKTSVEAGFVQFLNTLRFPVQLYVQTSSLNLKDINENYLSRIQTMRNEISRLQMNLKQAEKTGQQDVINKLRFDLRRKENVLEYGADITDYIARLSRNRNILQQKTYVVISYYSSEIGSTKLLSKEEMDSICFSELYTRAQTVIRALGSCGVIGKVLNSEELAELLYVAYNRDDSEMLPLSKVLDAEYDALYSTSKDVTQKRQEAINEAIEKEAVDLATESIAEADKKIKELLQNRKKIVKEKALEIVDEYRDDMDDRLYEETKKQILKEEQLTTNNKTKTIRRKKVI